MTCTPLDLGTWPRRQHFEFFREFEKPFFNVCTDLDVTGLVRCSRADPESSFFLASLHDSLTAANEVEPFRYRLRNSGHDVVVHDQIHGGSTVLLPDETFAFAYFDFVEDPHLFIAQAQSVIAERRERGPGLEPRPERDDLIHYSVLPWIRFTSFSHARRKDRDDSVPKIMFGKHHEREGRRWLPISVEVHHALVDGLHVGRYLERFQARLDRYV